jgi:hypothetical protein
MAWPVRSLACVAFLLAALLGLTSGYPFQQLPLYGDSYFALFRIAFFSLIILRLWRGRRAVPMLWGYQASGYLEPIWYLWLIVAAAGLLGLFGTIPALLNAVLFFIVFYRSRYYSIEDIYFQLASLFIIFLPTNQIMALDLFFNDASSWSIAANNPNIVIFLNAYAWLLALLLLSAAVEKILTENWRKGLSFYYFVAMPHLVLPSWQWLKSKKFLCQLASWLTVVGQGSLFLACLFTQLLPLIWLKQMVFGLLLLVVVDLSFIGQIFVLQFLLFFLISAEGIWHTGQSVAYTSNSVVGYGVMALLVLSAIKTFYADCDWYRMKMPKALDQIVRVFTGSCPIKVFGDAHLFGLYLYQVVDHENNNLWPAFNNDGSAGAMQRWHPRYYQGAMYSVTDACLARTRGAASLNKFVARLDDLIYATHKLHPNINCLTIRVKALNPSTDYQAETEHWLDSDWTPIYQGTIHAGIVSGQWLSPPPAVQRSTRVV